MGYRICILAGLAAAGLALAACSSMPAHAYERRSTLDQPIDRVHQGTYAALRKQGYEIVAQDAGMIRAMRPLSQRTGRASQEMVEAWMKALGSNRTELVIYRWP